MTDAYQPPPAGYVQAPPYVPPPYTLSAAITWAWYMFRKHWKVFVTGALPMVMAVLIYYGFFLAFYIPFVTDSSITDDEGFDLLKKMLILHGLFFVVMIPMTIVYANILRAALVTADGGTPTYRMLWSTRRAGRIIATNLLLGLGGMVGLLLCIVPGLAFGVFAAFTMAFVVDKDLTAIAAMRESFSLVRANLGLVLLTLLTVLALNYAGSYVPIVGMAVTLPLVLLIIAYAYRSMVPATPQS